MYHKRPAATARDKSDSPTTGSPPAPSHSSLKTGAHFSARLFIVFSTFLGLLATSVGARADCASEFDELLHSNLVHSPYEQRIKALVKDATGKYILNVDMTTQVKFPDRLRVISYNHRNSGLSVEIVMVGNKIWLRRDNDWVEEPAADINDTLEQMRQKGFLSGDISNIQCLGLADYDGRKLLSFSYTGVFNGIPVPMQWYVDPATRLPVVAKGSSSKDGLTFQAETTFRFGPEIGIEAPKP